MKAKITLLLGEAVAARIEAKAEARGITDIWKRAEDRALAELPEADEDALVLRAAARACQIAGIVSRTAPIPPISPITPIEPSAEPTEPSTPEN